MERLERLVARPKASTTFDLGEEARDRLLSPHTNLPLVLEPLLQELRASYHNLVGAEKKARRRHHRVCGSSETDFEL